MMYAVFRRSGVFRQISSFNCHETKASLLVSFVERRCAEWQDIDPAVCRGGRKHDSLLLLHLSNHMIKGMGQRLKREGECFE
jgi:hypothetical protein